jgi:hypothetical protein
MNKLSSDTFLPPNDVTDPADYQNDFLLWIEKQVELLRAKKFEQLDLDNIIEEMDSMGKSLRRELGSRLKVLLIHLLKCQFQPEKKSSGWLGGIEEQRSEILDLLEQNPSLRREVSNGAQHAYASAVRRSSIETGLPASTFPVENPYSSEQLLDLDFIP